MIDEEFKRIMKRMESGLRQEITDLQFEEYLNSFSKEDASIFERAIQRVIDTQRWIPVPAQLRVFIQQIKDEDQGKVNRERAEKKELEDARRKPTSANDHHRRSCLRFSRYMFENKDKYPTWLAGSMEQDEFERLRAKFEKEHPGWQPRKRPQTKRGGMTPLSQSLGDAMGNLGGSHEHRSY